MRNPREVFGAYFFNSKNQLNNQMNEWLNEVNANEELRALVIQLFNANDADMDTQLKLINRTSTWYQNNIQAIRAINDPTWLFILKGLVKILSLWLLADADILQPRAEQLTRKIVSGIKAQAEHPNLKLIDKIKIIYTINNIDQADSQKAWSLTWEQLDATSGLTSDANRDENAEDALQWFCEENPSPLQPAQKLRIMHTAHHIKGPNKRENLLNFLDVINGSQIISENQDNPTYIDTDETVTWYSALTLLRENYTPKTRLLGGDSLEKPGLANLLSTSYPLKPGFKSDLDFFCQLLNDVYASLPEKTRTDFSELVAAAGDVSRILSSVEPDNANGKAQKTYENKIERFIFNYGVGVEFSEYHTELNGGVKPNPSMSEQDALLFGFLLGKDNQNQRWSTNFISSMQSAVHGNACLSMFYNDYLKPLERFSSDNMVPTQSLRPA